MHSVSTGAGNVTEFDDNNTVIACFKGEGESHDLNCTVKNGDTQTDTVWSVDNYKGKEGLQTITNDEIFQISGDQCQTNSEFNHGNYLGIRNCSVIGLDRVTVHCGSHANPKQALVKFKVCGKLLILDLDAYACLLMSFLHSELPNVMVNKVIRLEEKTEKYPVRVISSSLAARNITWEKDGREIIDHVRQGITLDNFTISFDKIEKEDVGNYSVTTSIFCDKDSKPRSFNGNFTLDVICKFSGM